MRRVYIHVGLPKTGTSYLQKTLWASQDRLSRAGVLVPGENQQFQRHAVWDLLGRRLRGVDQPEVPGSWQALLASVQTWQGEQVVLSEEFLVHAGPGVPQRLVKDFQPAEVHIVVTVRDLERVLGSMWQQNLAKARSWCWPEFVAAVRDPEHGPPTAGVAFWLRYDLRRVLAIWAEAVPADRIHIVVVPPAGSSPTVLLERFAVAADLNVRALTPPHKEVNTALGLVEAELLRRLNSNLDGRLNERQYRHVVGLLKPVLRRRRGSNAAITLPRGERNWVAEASRELVEYLRGSPYDVVGDLDELLSSPDSDLGDDSHDVADDELADAAIAALTALAEHHATYWWKMRSRERVSRADARTRLSSARRALVFQVKVRALEAADSNRLLARAAGLYLLCRSGARSGRR